jgi:hypothetical protein
VEVSQRHYAEMRGVTIEAIRDAVRRGVIVLTVDGKVDVAQADATWGARRAARLRAGAQMAEIEERRRQAELEYLQARITLEKQKYEEGLARLVDRAEAQAEIDALVAALVRDLDHIGEDEPDPRNRAVLEEVAPLIKADLADLIALAPRVTQPDFELPQPPAQEAPPEAGDLRDTRSPPSVEPV